MRPSVHLLSASLGVTLDERLAAVGIRRLTRPQASHLVQKAAASAVQLIAADLVCSPVALRRAVLGIVPDPVEIVGG
jgi:hypothetical protein